MNCYLDTSALLKLYVAENGTQSTREVYERSEFVCIARIAAVEFVAAIARRMKIAHNLAPELREIIRQFKHDLLNDTFLVFEMDARMADQAMSLAQRHQLRGYDAVQLATGVSAKKFFDSQGNSEFSFVCADHELNVAAIAEKLHVFAV